MNTHELLDVLKAMAVRLDIPKDRETQDLLDDIYAIIHDIEVEGMALVRQ